MAILKTVSARTTSAIHIGLFVLVLVAGGALSFTVPKIQVSEMEKRELSGVPQFSWRGLFYGQYTDSLDLYYADNFPYRELWVSAATTLKDYLGYHPTSVKVYYTREEVPRDTLSTDKAINPLSDSALNSTATVIPGSSTTAEFSEISPADQTKGFNRILIYNDRAFNSFSPAEANAVSYGAVINSYRHILGEKVAVYCMVVPSPNDLYLPKAYWKETDSEENFIHQIHASLDSNVVAIDPFPELRQHQSEYLYFNTDHHWTARGAHCAYREFCAKAGFQPVELSQLTRGVKRKYLGSLYGLTLDKRLRNNEDSVEYFMPPIQTITLRYPERDLKDPIETPLFKETVSPINSYLVFLGGDYPLISVNTENHNGRKLLLIKDSFGNAAAAFFTLHFETVYIIDYRFFDFNIVNFARQNHVTDLIFLHNTSVANASFTGRRELYLMRTQRVFVPAPDSVRATK